MHRRRDGFRWVSQCWFVVIVRIASCLELWVITEEMEFSRLAVCVCGHDSEAKLLDQHTVDANVLMGIVVAGWGIGVVYWWGWD